MRHHVAFIVNNYPPSVGGVERHVSQLAGELVRQGHAVTVVTLSDTPGISVENGIDVIRMRKHLPVASVLAFPGLGSARAIRNILSGRGVTAVSTHTRFFPMSLVGGRVARCLGVPHVHTEHGSGFVRGVSPVIALASRMVDLTMGRRVLRASDRVLGVSEDVIEFVRRLASVDAQVFYNAIDLDEWPISPVTLTGTRFAFLGRLVPGKGWDTLLEASALVLADVGPIFTVDVIGGGPDAEAAERRVQELGLTDVVVLHGHVRGQELAALMQDTTLVNPSVLSEGFQTSLLEALAMRSRILSFPVPGLASLLQDGAPLFVVDQTNASALHEAMRDALGRPWTAYPRDRLEKWAWPARAGEFVVALDGDPREPVRSRGDPDQRS